MRRLLEPKISSQRAGWALPAALLLALAPRPDTASAAPLLFEQIAIEFNDGLWFLNPNVRPALADDGMVVFGGYDMFSTEKLFSGNGGALTTIHIDSDNYSNVGYVAVNSLGQVAFVSDRLAGQLYRGVYYTQTSGTFLFYMHEGPVNYDPNNPPVTYNVALSENGTVAFTTIQNGDGALYRNSLLSGASVLRQGSGTFFNNKRLDINNAGEVAVQMEYTDPIGFLKRGILLFDTPGQAVTAIDTAVEKMEVSDQPEPSINRYGVVAFAMTTTATMDFWDPPDDPMGTLVASITLDPGIYTATPTLMGQPSVVTKIADYSDGFTSFGDVRINDTGTVVFEASTATVFGIFMGPNPVVDKILAVGDIMGGRLFSWIRMGDLNNAAQLSMLTSDFYSTDRQVWRVSNVPEPSAHVSIIVGAIATAFLLRLRAHGSGRVASGGPTRAVRASASDG